jgi:signal transduction histidine kinase
MMAVTSIFAMFVGLLTALVGFAAWSGSRKDRSRTSFLWLALFVSAWIIGNVVYAWQTHAMERYVVALLSYMFAMFVAVQMFSFCSNLVEQKSQTGHKFLVLIGFILAVVSALPGVISYGVEGAAIMERTPALLAYGVILMFYLIAAGATLVRNRKTSTKIRVSTILVGICLSAVVGVVCNLLFPLFHNYDLTLIGPAGAGIFIFTIAYSIIKHQLFDIRLAVVRGLAYILSIATLGCIYFVVAFTVSELFLSRPVDTGSSVFYIVISILLVLLFQPIKRFFDRVTNRVFYKDNYNSDDFFGRLNRTLASTTDLRGLLERAAGEIGQTLKSEQTFFFINAADGRYVSAGTPLHKQLPKSDAAQLADVRDMSHGVIVASLRDSHDPIRRLMASHRIELILPLIQAGVPIGYLCLGEHLNSGYTIRDMKVLGTISDELAIAIQNALSVQVVKSLNETLQQRINDATRELRASNAQLQRLDKAKDEFVSMASHQLRTPLTSVKGYISMVIEGDAGKITETQKHLLEEAFNSSERMVHLINDFLNVSRLQTGKFMIDKRPINLAKVVEQELDSLATNASSRNLTFVYRAPIEFPTLNLDESKMRQVIMNFADNSLYYSTEHTHILVRLVVEGDEVIFTVKDTGIGVPLTEQSQLFSKFYRASNARKQRPDGTGVGLFLAKKVIDAHGGKVIFESVEGKGSTFGFRLPLAKLRAVDDTK